MGKKRPVDPAPGRDAINAALRPLYGAGEPPFHFSRPKDGSDPLDAVSVYAPEQRRGTTTTLTIAVRAVVRMLRHGRAFTTNGATLTVSVAPAKTAPFKRVDNGLELGAVIDVVG